MEASELRIILEQLRPVALEAGRLLSSYFNDKSRLQAQHKSSSVDLVSLADTEAEALLRARLLEIGPSFGFVGEESSDSGEEDQKDYFWCVDPLDGTSNFLCGLPIWSVSIALCRRGYEPLLGLVHSPTLGRSWEALLGGGAYCNGEPMRVRSEPPGGGLHNSMLATGFPYDITSNRDDINIRIYGAMQSQFQKVRRLGSAAIDLAFVAEGVYDGMWEAHLRSWDAAAGAILVSEAGGLYSRYDGSRYLPGGGTMIAAATPALLSRLQELLRPFALI